MIELLPQHYISEGLARKCFYHPDNASRCIKIGKPGVEVSHLYKEIDYFKKIAQKNTAAYDYPFYAMYHGEIETNLGTGFVYDLITDAPTEKVSLTLRHYLEMTDSPYTDKQFYDQLDRLKNEMITHRVFVGDFRARNICVRVIDDSNFELIVIDGLGHRDFFPLADWFTYFARKKVKRRFLKNKLHSLEEQRALIKHLRDKGEKII